MSANIFEPLKSRLEEAKGKPEVYSWYLEQLLETGLISEEEFAGLAKDVAVKPEDLEAWVGKNLKLFDYTGPKVQGILTESRYVRNLSRDLAPKMKNRKMTRKKLANTIAGLLAGVAQDYSYLMGENMLDSDIRDEMFFEVLEKPELKEYLTRLFTGKICDPETFKSEEKLQEADDVFNAAMIALGEYMFYQAKGGQEPFDGEFIFEEKPKDIHKQLTDKLAYYDKWNSIPAYRKAFEKI